MGRESLVQRARAMGSVIVDRLAWPGRGEPGRVFQDPVTMARTFTYLFGAGATLLLVSLTLPHSPDRDTAGLLAVTVAAYASAIGFLAIYDRLPVWAFQAAPLWGTILISLCVYFGGPEAAAPPFRPPTADSTSLHYVCCYKGPTRS